MFKAGAFAMRRTSRKPICVVSVSAVLVLLVGGLSVIGPQSVAGASTKTTVSSFAAKPASLTWTGEQ